MRIKKIYFNRMYDQWRGEPLYVEDGLDDDKLYIRIMDVENYKRGAVNTITVDYKDLNGATYTILGECDYDKRLAIFDIPLSILSNNGVYEVSFSLSFNTKDKEGVMLKTAIQTFEIIDTIEADDEAIAQDPHYPILVDLINQLADYKVDTSIFPTREEMVNAIDESINLDKIIEQINNKGYITQTQLNNILKNYLTKFESSDFARRSDLNKFVTNIKFIQELDRYVLKSSMNNYVLKEEGKTLTTHDLTDELYEKLVNLDLGEDGVEIDLSEYQKKIDDILNTKDKTITGAINEIKNDIPTKTSQLQNDSGYLTQHQDLSDYAKKTELHSHENKDILDNITTEKVSSWDNKSEFDGDYDSLTNKPTIPTKVSELENDNLFVTEKFVDDKIIEASLGKEVDLSEYAKKTDIPYVPTKVSELENDKGYASEQFVDKNIPIEIENLSGTDNTKTMLDYLKEIVGFFISDTIILGNKIKYKHIIRGKINTNININEKEYSNISYISMINVDYNILTTFILADEGNLRIETPYTPILDDANMYIGLSISQIGEVHELIGSGSVSGGSSHEHDNKDILDTITQEMINTWNNKSDLTINDNINEVSKTQTYSNEMIESRLLETNTEITAVQDDLDSMDERVTYLETEQTKMGGFDGSYDSLTNKPVIPSKTSELTNDSEFVTKEYVDDNLPHYNETLKFEISGDDYSSFMNNNYFNMNALNIDETKSYIVKNKFDINDDEEYTFEFIYNKENDVLINEDNQLHIYNHKSYNGTNLIEDVNSAVLTNNNNITPMITTPEYDGYFRLYEVDKVEIHNNYLPDDVIIRNSLTVGTRIGDVGICSVAEGAGTTASGEMSHAEGDSSIASDYASHAEGGLTIASGYYAHTEGYNTIASGYASHAEGNKTIASSENQHVQGKLNIEDTENKYAHIVGNGVSDFARSNAHTLDWQGNGWYKGKLSQDGIPAEDKDLATKKYVDDNNYYTYPTILYDDNSLPLGYVDITTLETTKVYKIPKGTLNGALKKIPLKAPNDDGTWFMVDDGSNSIGWGGYNDTTITVFAKSNTNIMIYMNSINGYNKLLSIKKTDGVWSLNQSKVNVLATGNTQEYTPTKDYNPATKKYVDDKVAGVNASTITGLSTVATSGDYNDLTNKPTIPSEYTLPTASATQLGGVKIGAGLSINDGVLSANGGGTADSVDWSNVQNRPTIPSKVSQLTNDSGFITSIPSEYITETELNAKGYLTEHQDISGKVDKVNGKGLSTNDLTNTLKANYDTAYTHSQSTHAPSNAQKNSDITKAEIETKLIGNISTHTHSQYLTSIPNEYITETELNAKGYLTEHQSLDGLATETYVNTKVSELVDSAPETLDTLKELSTALGDDPNFATTVSNQIGNKVDKVDGKSLVLDTEIAKIHSHDNKTILDGITSTNISNWNSAYTHSTSTHAPSNAQANADITKAEIEAKLIGDISTHTHSQYLTEHQDLSDYALATDLHSHTNKTILDNITQTTIDMINNAIPYKGVVQASGNLNNCTATGFYKIQQGASNLPINEYSFLMVYNEAGQSTLIQVWFSATSDKQRIRRRANLTWGSWYTVYTENEPPTIPSEYITETELNDKGYATEDFVTETVNNASMSGGYTHPETHPASMITGLSTVATSGSYNDLTNKPTIPTVTNDLTNALKSNYDTAYTHSQSAHAPSNAEANVQADWNVTDTGSDAYIKNKPTIPSIDGLASTTYVDSKVAGIVNSAPETLDTLNELATALGNDPNFATTVANQIGTKVDKVDGKGLSTNDLTDTLKSNYDTAYTHSQSAHAPSNAQKNSDITKAEIEAKLTGNITTHTHSQYLTSHQSLDGYVKTTDLSTVATSGSYNDLSDKPTIPTAYTHPSTHPASMITGLSKVATSGSYNDLSNKPTIPTIPDSLPANGGNADTVNNFRIWSGTQAQYDAIRTKDANTIYLIKEG